MVDKRTSGDGYVRRTLRGMSLSYVDAGHAYRVFVMCKESGQVISLTYNKHTLHWSCEDELANGSGIDTLVDYAYRRMGGKHYKQHYRDTHDKYRKLREDE